MAHHIVDAILDLMKDSIYKSINKHLGEYIAV